MEEVNQKTKIFKVTDDKPKKVFLPRDLYEALGRKIPMESGFRDGKIKLLEEITAEDKVKIIDYLNTLD